MKAVLRNILALVLGLAVGGSINMALIVLGPSIIPPPAGVDVTDTESIAASIHLFEVKHFVFPFIAHALGTLSGAFTAYTIAASFRTQLAYVIGIAFFTGGVFAVLMIPSPTWFTVLDLVVAYIPMAWLGQRAGWKFVNRSK